MKVLRPLGLPAASLGLLMLAACVVGPDYRRPALAPAAGYGAAAAGSFALDQRQDIPAQWWSVFHCAELDALVDQALKNNPTIDAADAALRAAREQVLAQRGAALPNASVSLQPSHQTFAQNLASPLQSGSEVYDLTTTQVSVGYTPDLFGANARTVESLAAQADQQRFGLEAARLTLASNVVVAAIQDALLRAEIKETRTLVADQVQTVESFHRQLDRGQVSSADLAAQQAQLAQLRATLPPLDRQFRINRDLLAALVGRTPAEPVTAAFELEALGPPGRLPLSLPAQLVEHRPDVRAAEAQLHAASAQIGMAEAAKWPNVQLQATAGGAALGLAPGFGPRANFWSLAGALTQPLFDGGVAGHHEKAARAAYRQAAAQYRSAVITAFQNTTDVLQALATDQDAVSAAEASQNATAQASALAKRQLELGQGTALAVLAADEAWRQAQIALLQARAGQASDTAALFQALGGGWWNEKTAG